MITKEFFYQSLNHSSPPDNLSIPLLSLWHLKKGNWNEAHNLIQDLQTSDAAWIHGLLHKIEGDHWNANYWYRRAGMQNLSANRDQEWEDLVDLLIPKS